jgi:hypothetical protein
MAAWAPEDFTSRAKLQVRRIVWSLLVRENNSVFSATLGDFASFVTHMKALAKVSLYGRTAEVPMMFTIFPGKRRGSSSCRLR